MTLGTELHRQFLEHDPTCHWKPKTMHVFCICHKTGLIVHAGLDALGIKPKRHRHATLANFPNIDAMESVAEEDESIVIDVEEPGKSTSNNLESEDDDRDIGRLLDSDDEDEGEEEESDNIDDEDPEDPEPPHATASRSKKGLAGTRMARLIKNVSC